MKSFRTAISSLRWLLLLWSLLGMCGVSLLFSGILVLGLVGAGLLAWLAYSVWGYVKQVRAEWAPNLLSENAYCVLGVDRDADAETIRKAFRQLVQQHHPDVVPPDMKEGAAANFIRISQAYELLSDREKRFQYDGWIDDLEGDIPPFDEAYARLKDEDKHPIYEAYDALYNPNRFQPLPVADEGRAAPSEGSPAEESGSVQESTCPVEVSTPESVLDTMGDVREDQSHMSELAACTICGRPCDSALPHSDPVVCDSCAGS